MLRQEQHFQVGTIILKDPWDCLFAIVKNVYYIGAQRHQGPIMLSTPQNM